MMKITSLLFLLSLFLSFAACQVYQPVVSPAATAITNQAQPDGCPEIEAKSPGGQEAYRGLFPGTTARVEAQEILGQPTRKYLDGSTEMWYFDTFDVAISNGLVKRVSVYEERRTIEALVQEYGCPDIVLHISITSGEGADYFLFVYYSRGIQFDTPGFRPVRITDIPGGLTYFRPVSSLEDYFEEIGYLDPAEATPVPWNEAVR